jgi:hypothetical protein
MVDLASMMSGLEQQATQTISAAAPAIISGIESAGAAQLQGMAQADAQAATAGITAIINQPGTTNPVLLSIQNSLKNAVSSSVFKQYGAQIIIGGVIGLWFIKKVL